MKLIILSLLTIFSINESKANDLFQCPKGLREVREYDFNEQSNAGKVLKLFTSTHGIPGAKYITLDSQYNFIKVHYKFAPLRKEMFVKSGQVLKIKNVLREGPVLRINVDSNLFDHVLIKDERDATNESMRQFFVLCKQIKL